MRGRWAAVGLCLSCLGHSAWSHPGHELDPDAWPSAPAAIHAVVAPGPTAVARAGAGGALPGAGRPKEKAPASDLPAHFDPRALVEPITEIEGTLSDGSRAAVYRIVVRSLPTDHEPGPWAPATLDDAGGYWQDTVDKKFYRVDGEYLRLLNGRGWDMFDADGTVHRTRDRAEFDKVARQELAGWDYERAAREGVTNSVIELQPVEQIVTLFLPKNPTPAAKPTPLRQARFTPRSGIGIGVDGVRFFPPEPVHRITAFRNIAPLDPHGGHTGFGHEYHYHRAPAVMADDKTGQVVGYALDGFPILGPTEADGGQPAGLDEINGHDHDGIGYHYHACNRWPFFVAGFRGPLGTAALGRVAECDATARPGRGPPGRAPPPRRGGDGRPPASTRGDAAR